MTDSGNEPRLFRAVIDEPKLTRIPGVIDKRDVRPGMAHFAGTGPPAPSVTGARSSPEIADTAKANAANTAS
jgi:hypothetical protein